MPNDALVQALEDLRRAQNTAHGEAGECLAQKLLELHETPDADFWGQVNGANIEELFGEELHNALLKCVKLTGDVPSVTGTAKQLTKAVKLKSTKFKDDNPEFFDAVANITIRQHYKFKPGEYLMIFLER
jgi:hypothetical protein